MEALHSNEADEVENEHVDVKNWWKELQDRLYWLTHKSLVPGYKEQDIEDINILKQVIRQCKDNSNWKEERELMLDFGEKLFSAQRRVVDENFDRMEHTLECTENVIADYRDMANCVKVLKQNVRNVLSQTKFNSYDIFQTFFTVEKLSEEVRLLKVIEKVSHAPERYKLLVDGKHFVHAVHTLSSCINQLESEELKPIQALSAMNGEMKGNVVHLETIIVEGLKEHLYLNADACWDLQESQRGLNRISCQLSTKGVVNNQHDFDRILNSVFNAQEFQQTEPLDENPETESFFFIAKCIEALSFLGADIESQGAGGKECGGRLAEAVRRIHSSIQFDLHQLVTCILEDFDACSGQESESLVMSSVPIDGEKSTQENLASLLAAYVSPSDQVQMTRLLTQMSVLFERVMLNFSFFIVALNRKADQLDALYPHMPDMIPIFPLGTDSNDHTSVWSSMQNIVVTFMKSYLQVPESSQLNMAKLTSLDLEEVDFEFCFEDLHLESNEFDEMAFSKRKFRTIDSLPASPFFIKIMHGHQNQLVRKMQNEISEHCFFLRGNSSSEEPWKPERGLCPITDFLNSYTTHEYFPFIGSQLKEYLDQKLSSPEAFKRVSKRNKFGSTWYDPNNEKGAMIDAAAQAQMVLEFLYEGASSVEEDTFLDQYLQVIERIVERQLVSAVNDFIHRDFSGIGYKSTTAARLDNVLDPREFDPGSYGWLLYNEEPYLKEFKEHRTRHEHTCSSEDASEHATPEVQPPTVSEVREFESKELPFDTPFLDRIGPKGHDPGGKAIQLMGIHALSQLAAIANSMNWLAYNLLLFRERKQSIDKDLDLSVQAQLIWDSKLAEVLPRLNKLVDLCHGIADKCFIYIRTEIRNVCIVNCQVVKSVRRTFPEEQSDIDASISTLIKELTRRFTPALVFLTKESGRVFGTSAGFFVARILRKMLSVFAQINHHGASQMINSIYNFVSIMNLDSYISEDETEAIHMQVHPYFVLFSEPKPQQAMLKMVEKSTGPPVFTLEEFEWIWKKTQNCTDPVDWTEIVQAYTEKDPSHMERAEEHADKVQRMLQLGNFM